MLRRLFAMIVLVGIVGAAWYVWTGRGEAPGTPAVLATGLDGRLSRFGSGIQDAKVTASVRTALSLNRNLEAYDIDVTTSEGVVTLTGQVAGEALERTALEIAGAVPDVARVDDQLRVDPSAAALPGDGRTVGEVLDDRGLEAKIRLAFSLNRNLQGTTVDVRAFRRAVTLGGDVARPEQRQLAVSIAQQAPNVSGVTDEIRVGGQPAPTAPAAAGVDTNAAQAPGAPAGAAQPTPAGATSAASGDAAESAKRAIAANPNLAGYGLQARVDGHRLVLSGRVRTGAEKDLAGFLAREASGLPTDNALEIRP